MATTSEWAEFMAAVEPGCVIEDKDGYLWTKGSDDDWTCPVADVAWESTRDLAVVAARIVALPVGGGHCPSGGEVNGMRSVHSHFGLSYASWLAVPRVVLQSMPPGWQDRFVRCLDELAAVTGACDVALPATKVDVGEWVYVEELSDAQMAALGITEPDEDDEDDEDDDDGRDDGGLYFDANGKELWPSESVFVPGVDPFPGYRHHRYTEFGDAAASAGIH